jgi:hypothetical protein
MRRGVRERKRTSNGGAQNAKKHRPAAAADEDKENSPSAGSRCDRKRASKEEAQNPKKSRSAVAKDDEIKDVFAFFDTHFEKPTREMQKQVPKKRAASKGRLVRDEENGDDEEYGNFPSEPCSLGTSREESAATSLRLLIIRD